MVGRVPAAIEDASDFIVRNVTSAEFSGISNPKYQGAFGYHHSRNHLAIYHPNDLSTVHPLDRLGAPDACSALDIKLSIPKMKEVTVRLINACRANDPRARAIAEIGGTFNGSSTIGWDQKNSPDENNNRYEFGWDSTHLWHVHISGWRKYADDREAWMDVAKLFANVLEEDMTPDEMVAAVVKRPSNVRYPDGGFGKPEQTGMATDAPTFARLLHGVYAGVSSIAAAQRVNEAAEAVRDAATSAAIKALADALAAGGGDVDSAAVVAAVRAEAEKTRTAVLEKVDAEGKERLRLLGQAITAAGSDV